MQLNLEFDDYKSTLSCQIGCLALKETYPLTIILMVKNTQK